MTRLEAIAALRSIYTDMLYTAPEAWYWKGNAKHWIERLQEVESVLKGLKDAE